MSNIEIDANADETGSIRICLPTTPAHHAVHVVIEWEDPQVGWPPGWFGATAGSIADRTFLRHPQGEYEKRDEIE